PTRNQYEQFYNCLVVQKKGVGEFSEKPSEEELRFFLKNLKVYGGEMGKISYNPNEPLRVLEKAVKRFEKANAPDRI
ncbi:MAG: hypothetical protein KKD18_00930, partial [Nanoarchaeota archaeon]|nr:hypothetical protein [Nanoarchaeota archaeon]